MSTSTVRLEGFEATIRALKRQPDVAVKALKRVVHTSTFRLESVARGLVPVDTGDLLHALQSTSPGLTGRVFIGPGGRSTGGRVPPSVYGWMVEMGTVHRAATPFMRPAAETEEPKFIADARGIGPELERDFGST
jgi:hypothetical protein